MVAPSQNAHDFLSCFSDKRRTCINNFYKVQQSLYLRISVRKLFCVISVKVDWNIEMQITPSIHVVCLILALSTRAIICASVLRQNAQNSTCTAHGVTFSGSYNFGPCMTCFCNNGSPNCAVRECARPMCLIYTRGPDECCETCQVGGYLYIDVFYNNDRNVFDNWPITCIDYYRKLWK